MEGRCMEVETCREAVTRLAGINEHLQRTLRGARWREINQPGPAVDFIVEVHLPRCFCRFCEWKYCGRKVADREVNSGVGVISTQIPAQHKVHTGQSLPSTGRRNLNLNLVREGVGFAIPSGPWLFPQQAIATVRVPALRRVKVADVNQSSSSVEILSVCE